MDQSGLFPVPPEGFDIMVTKFSLTLTILLTVEVLYNSKNLGVSGSNAVGGPDHLGGGCIIAEFKCFNLSSNKKGQKKIKGPKLNFAVPKRNLF